MNIWSFFKIRDDYWLCVKRWRSFLVFPLVSPFLMWFIILLFGLCPCQLYNSLTPTHCSPSVRSHSPEWGACSSLCHLLRKELTLKKLQQHLHHLKWITDIVFHLATLIRISSINKQINEWRNTPGCSCFLWLCSLSQWELPAESQHSSFSFVPISFFLKRSTSKRRTENSNQHVWVNLTVISYKLWFRARHL